MNKTKLNGALDSALTGAKARNLKTVRGLLDIDEGKQPHYDPQGGAGPNDHNATQDLVNAFKQ